ncbi:DUF6221 family protein [Streptomyces zaomyceticus]|uniref:DUF6221 family protein n=1 Tax=Streptomyces zaomyceticus TaxID=68286 RepID=UPI00364784A8
MDDLITFLRARLDEDEQTARAAGARPGPVWRHDSDSGWVRAAREGDGIATGRQDRLPPEHGRHIARHDPARVLAEVYARRRLLGASAADCPAACAAEGAHSFRGSCALRWMGPVDEADGGRWLHDDTGARFPAPPVTQEWTLRVLALPYAGHPDYRTEWRP